MRFWLWFIAALAACFAVARPGVWAVAALAVFVFGLVWSDGIRARVKRKMIRADEELTEQVSRYETEVRRYRREVEHIRAGAEKPDEPAAESVAADAITIG